MNIKTKKIVIASVFVAIGVLLPQLFHMFGLAGPIFLPMHIPVLLGGMITGSMYGAVIGFIVPIVSFIYTGGAMPPMTPVPVLLFMIFELTAYGFFAGLFMKKFKLNEYVVLILSMICGRIVLGVVVFILVNTMYSHLQITPISYVIGGFIQGITGVIIQLITIPFIYKVIHKYI